MRNGTPMLAIRLHTDDPGEGGDKNEVTYPGYAQAVVALGASQMRARPGAPRTRLRLLATNEQDTLFPVLVCETCKAWTRHTPALGHEASGTKWACGVDGTRRTWGAK